MRNSHMRAVLSGVSVTIAAGLAIVAVRAARVVVRGIDEYEAIRISQTSDDRSDDTGSYVNGANKGPPSAAV